MERPSWDQYFMEMAVLTSRRSTCMRRQVGAVIIEGIYCSDGGFSLLSAGSLKARKVVSACDISHRFAHGLCIKASVYLPAVVPAKDIGIAKNYLDGDELKILNNLVSGYFDFAEIQAMRRNPMHMKDYIQQLDAILSSTGEKLLDGPGRVSHAQAMEKAKAEYKKYLQDNLSPVEEAYLQSLKGVQKKVTKKTKKEAT